MAIHGHFALASHTMIGKQLQAKKDAFFKFGTKPLLLAPLAIYRTAQATQGELARDGQFSFDEQGRESKRP
jgi:hypothetical protein